MKKCLDAFDCEAEAEGKAIKKHSGIRAQRPYYGKGSFRKISWNYLRDIADAEIIFQNLVREDVKQNPITL